MFVKWRPKLWCQMRTNVLTLPVIQLAFLLMSSAQKRRSATRTESDRWRRSLQTCPVESNEEMLEGLLHHYRNNRSKSCIIEGLLFVLRQLLAAVCTSVDTACRAWGFLTFDEAFGIFKSFFDHEVEKDPFQDHLLHPEYGLRVNVATVKSKR